MKTREAVAELTPDFLLGMREHLMVRNRRRCSEVQDSLMRKRCSARVEGVVAWVFEQVLNRRHVQVGKPNQAPREIRRVVVRPENAAKPRVKQGFQLPPGAVTTETPLESSIIGS